MRWLSGWAYRRAITITEQSGSTLTDYQVKIELNSSNFDFSKANADGSDIRFTEDDGTTLLSYWIEKWDSSNEEAVIWVKVPSIPANESVTIYFYYGNSEAESESDANAVFDFYDDFDTLDSAWQTWGGASFTVENGQLHIYNTAGDSGIYRTDVSFSDFIYEAKEKIVSREPASLIARVQNNNNFYMFAHWIGSNGDESIRIDKKSSGSYNTLAPCKVLSMTSHDWGITRAILSGNSLKIEVLDLQYNLRDSLVASDSTFASGGVGFRTFGDTSFRAEGYVDWVRVRKYAEQEPSINVGSEEVAIFTISGIVKLPDGTPVEGATVISIREDTFEIFDTTTSGSDGSYTLNGFINSGNTVIVIPPSSDKNGDIKCHIQPA